MTDSKVPKLRVSRAEAYEKIQSRIDIGKGLRGGKINTKTKLDNLESDTKKWTDYNRTLFGALFQNSPLPWTHGVASSYTYDRGLRAEVADHREHISRWINDLESIYDELEIYTDLPSNTQQSTNQNTMNNENKKIFIGHGGSPMWRELKDFIEDTLKLPCAEFNRISAAGEFTGDRLKEMLEESCMAFLIMTGEDEQADGSLRARENVIHEVGLFQGRLGFKRAIILLEKGCQEFSNIHGLGQIRFSKGNIKESFGEVVEVLKRESIT